MTHAVRTFLTVGMWLSAAAMPAGSAAAADEAFTCDFPTADSSYVLTVPAGWTVPTPGLDRAVGAGRYVTKASPDGGGTVLIRQATSLTIVEVQSSDNAFIITIWLDRSESGSVEATLLLSGRQGLPVLYRANTAFSGTCSMP